MAQSRPLLLLVATQTVFAIVSLGLLSYIISKFVSAKSFIDHFDALATLSGLAKGVVPKIPSTFESFGGLSSLGITAAELSSPNLAALLPTLLPTLMQRLPVVLSHLSDILKVLLGLGATTLAFNALLVLANFAYVFLHLKDADKLRGWTAVSWAVQFVYFAIGLSFIAYTGHESQKGNSTFYAFVAMWVLTVVVGVAVVVFSIPLLRGQRKTEEDSEMREKNTAAVDHE
ncbi:hypothetical protein ACQY0O_004599 [Thecaphora frezii]